MTAALDKPSDLPGAPWRFPTGRQCIAALHRLLGELPQRRGHVCVYGWPDHEENSLFAALLLSDVPELRVTLLASNPAAARKYLRIISSGSQRVEVVAKSSMTGLLRASMAEILLFTHGLYGSPDFARRKLVINLWHGYGPKANDNSAFSARIPFTVLTCNTPVWGAAAARWLGAEHARVRRSGNPRQVAFSLPARPEALARLGLDQERFVIWMPTYRSANGASGPRWRDAPDLAARIDASGANPVTEIVRLATAAGVKIIVKPHPLDTAQFENSGLRVITTDEILQSGMTLYQLVAASSGMISDYSSIWVEYLDLDKPLVLYCPDLSDYTAGRGFSQPTMTELASDLIARTPGAIEPFLAALAAGKDWRQKQRRRTRDDLKLKPGLVDPQAFTQTVLEELDRHRSLHSQVKKTTPLI